MDTSDLIFIARRFGGTKLVRLLKESNSEFERANLRADRNSSRRTRGHGASLEALRVDALITISRQNIAAERRVDFLLEVGSAHLRAGELDRAKTILGSAAREAEKRGDMKGAARACLGSAEAHFLRAEWDACKTLLARALQIAHRQRLHSISAAAENALATVLGQQGQAAAAQRHLRRAFLLAEKTGNKELGGKILSNLGNSSHLLGNYSEAFLYYRRALSRNEVLGNLQLLAEVHLNLGLSHHARGTHREALKQFDLAITEAAKAAIPGLLATAFLAKASTHVALKDLRLAQAFTTRALDGFTKLNYRTGVADTSKVEGMIQRELGHAKAAEALFRNSIRINLEIGNLNNAGESWLELGRLYSATGARDNARDAFQQSLALFRKAGARADAATAKRELESLRKRRQDAT